jgi:hypothetical protein
MWSKLQSLWLFALLLATLQTCSCAREKTITRDEVRSQLKSATSLLAESDMLIDFLRAKRVTRNHAEAHPSYLQDN